MSSSSHPNNTSPIRKQLAKRMINYYDQLSNGKMQDRSRSTSKERANRSLSRSRSKEMGGSRGSLTKSGLTESELYEESEHRRLKMHKLKELMVTELDRARNDGALDPDFETLEKLHKGYPSFMKEQETPEHMLEDHHHTNLKAFLNEKVETFDKNPEEDSYDSAEEDFVPESPTRSQLLMMSKLYHIVVEQPLETPNKVSEQCFDFHQRKAKEIRRLQYAAGVGKKTSTKPKLIYYAVWVLVSGYPVPALLGTKSSFNSESKDTLTITEDDQVKVKPEKDNKHKIGDFEGKIKKQRSDEPECDFIAETEDGTRHPIWIHLREKKAEKAAPMQEIKEEKPIEKVQAAPPKPARNRNLATTNCTLYDTKTNRKLGRAFAELIGKDSVSGNDVVFMKGILLDSNNQVSLILFKKLSNEECIVKKSNGDQSLENITGESQVKELGPKAYKVTLKKGEEDKGPWSREVYFFEGDLNLEKLKIFDDEFVKAPCENTIDYQGKTEWRSKKASSDPELDEGDLFILYKDSLGRKESVRLEPDGNNDDKLKMAKLMEYILTLAKHRLSQESNYNIFRDARNTRDMIEITETRQTKMESSKTKTKKTIELGELKFNIVDKKGRKIKIMIKNDSENEDVDSSDEEGIETRVESAYYHLMVDNEKVIPYRRREVKKTPVKAVEKSSRAEVKVVTETTRTRHSTQTQSQSPDRTEKSANRAVLSRIAAHQGLTFASDQLFESFAKFMESLPEDVNQSKAIEHYKEMMSKVMTA